MKKIKLLYLIGLSVIYSCTSDTAEPFKPNSITHFINEDCVLIEKRIYDSEKYTFLLQSVSNPNYYFLWTDKTYGFDDINTEKFYTYGISDTLHWDYIRKDRFFINDDIKIKIKINNSSSSTSSYTKIK
jgi:hypothetical protein